MSLLVPQEQPMKVRWPYKYLWNVLRGESVVADDEVIQEELRVAYERIILALTQYSPYVENDKEVQEETDDTEKKLKRRIAVYLDLEESTAWDVFCGYMMFEYRGGSTSFEKLLDMPRMSTDFLVDLKQYYIHERLSVLLVIQTIFGYASKMDHKYNHIFGAVCDWIREDKSTVLTENLIKSLDMAKNVEEEVYVLHALTLFIYHIPSSGVEEFCSMFVSFKPGIKEEKLLQAEAALVYTVVNFPTSQESEKEIPLELQKLIPKFLETNLDDLLMNDYNTGAVLSGYFTTGLKNEKLKESLGQPKHRFHLTFETMLKLARSYSYDSVENSRNNLSAVVLKGLLFALRSIAENFKQDKIFRCGSRDCFYELAAKLMDHSEVAALLLSDEGSVLVSTVSEMADFPLKLKHFTQIWGSLCSANAIFPNHCIPLLKDCCKMVTVLAESLKSTDSIKEILSLHANGFKLLAPRVVAGVILPTGTELDHFYEDTEKNIFTLYWRVPDNMVLDVFSIINSQLLVPLASQLNVGIMGTASINDLISWVHDENENLWSVLKFLIKYATVSFAITETLCQLYEPMAFIVYKTLSYINQWDLKSDLCCHLIDLLVASNKFGIQPWTNIYFSEIWPMRSETGIISEIIMGHESVAANDCKVTISFLKSILSLFKGYGSTVKFANTFDEKTAFNAVDFVNENVFHSFTRWRFSTVQSKYEILLNCLKVYSCVFDLKKEGNWTQLRDNCARSLLAPNSSLMTILSAQEDEMQLSVIQPTKENFLVPDIIYHSLSVLLKLFQFENKAIKLVDATLGSTLVQKLGRFARHRLDYKIPTLAMALLKKIAEEINMSLLSCFGSEEVAFRDLILQRLEFRSEDVNLKVSILDFLTVAAHTQPGLTQFVFMDDFLAQKIVDLPTEKDEGLALAVLCFLRALFRKGANVIKKCHNLWENIFFPMSQLQSGGRMKIITCTLNIASFELFRYGLANTNFSAEVKSLLKEENFINLFKLVLQEGSDHTTKCLSSFKHFISVVLHRNDLEDIFSDSLRKEILSLVTEHYWTHKEDQELLDAQTSKVMMDLMCQLLNSIKDGTYIGEYLLLLSEKLSKHFFEDNSAIQISTLTLTNLCMKRSLISYLNSTTLENILRVTCRVFDNAAKIFKLVDQDLENIAPLIVLSASIIITIIKSVHPKEWQVLFHRYAIPHSVVHATHEGLHKCYKEKIILELLYVMLKMAEVKECAEALVSGMIVNKVFLYVMRNSESGSNEEDTKWFKIYLVTLQLMTQMLRTEQIFFVENSVNLWGSHGSYILEKLNSLPAITTKCQLNKPDYNFHLMKNLFTFSIYALDAISAMIPFWRHWTLNSHYEHLRVMEAVYTAMQTSVNLIDQPQYLQSFITYSHMYTGKSFTELKPTAQLLELQSKLWDVIHSSTRIYWSLRTYTDDITDNSKILGTSNQIAQSAIKSLSKPERRSHHSGGSGTGNSSRSLHLHHIGAGNATRIMETLEMALSLYFFHSTRIIEVASFTAKQKQNIMREVAGDASTLCDGVRKISTSHPSDLLNKLCRALETTFNPAGLNYRAAAELQSAFLPMFQSFNFDLTTLNTQIHSFNRINNMSYHSPHIYSRPRTIKFKSLNMPEYIGDQEDCT